MTTIMLKDVSKTYPASGKEPPVQAVRNVSFSVQEGEFLVVLGPSGCGKTTTLRLVAGLEKADAGDLYIKGHRVNDIPERSRNLAMVFQQYALYPHMSVRENIRFPLKLRGISGGPATEKVNRALQMLGMEDLADRYPSELSGGQKQRVALGRAIVRDPAAFLMDEPLSNLDATLRVRMRSEIKELQRELGITTIYVTHDQSEAMSIADRIIVMRDGVIVQDGDPREIYRSPVNRFVAGFIGTPAMSFLEYTLRTDEGRRLCDFGEAVWEISERTWQRVTGDVHRDRGILGVRPRDVELLEDAEANAIPALVELTESEGDNEIIHTKVGLHEVRAVVNLLDLRNTPAHGDRVWLALDERRVFFFDLETERAIPPGK